MKEITIEISASMVAWYGAIVATLAVIISGWIAWRDRARIVVTSMGPYRVTPGGPYDPTKDYIAITVANHGRRPKTVNLVGVKLRSGKSKHIGASDALIKGPQELTEGRSFHYYMKEEGDLSLENVKYVWANDQTGKQFRGKLRKI